MKQRKKIQVVNGRLEPIAKVYISSNYSQDVTEDNGLATVTVENENETVVFSSFHYGEQKISFAEMGDVVVLGENGIKSQNPYQTTTSESKIITEEELARTTTQEAQPQTTTTVEPKKKESIVQKHFGKITFAAILLGGIALANKDNN